MPAGRETGARGRSAVRTARWNKGISVKCFLDTLGPNETQLVQRHRTGGRFRLSLSAAFLPVLPVSITFNGEELKGPACTVTRADWNEN